jgi:hypothetical protein
VTKATLTASTKRRITEDWQACFPNLGVAQPLWLMKRNGPLLIGICLDRTRSNDVYVPAFHVHSLLAPRPAITLTLYRPVPDERQPRLKREIRVDRHDSTYLPAAESLKSQVPDLSSNDTSLSRILGLYNEYLESRRNPAIARYPVVLFSDVTLLSFWAGHVAYAEACLERACEAMSVWPKQEVDLLSWRKRMEALMDRTRLDGVVREELQRHHLAHLPCYALESGGPVEPSIADLYLAQSAV